MFLPLKLPRNFHVDFVKLRFLGFGISGLLCVLSLVFMMTKGLNFGIDFKGGILLEVRSTQVADLASMRETLNNLNLGEIALQEFGTPNDVLIRVQQQEGGDEAQKLAVDKIQKSLGTDLEYRRVEFVGPKVGGELVHTGIIAVLLACLAIGGYIWVRFEWQYGVAALIALLHDVLTTVGLFSFLQLDFNLSTTAAVLTIAGYSINDTVVIFDRIRENLRRYKKMPLPELLNRSMNETLMRTFMTSGMTFIAVLSLFIWGGEVIRSFSFAMLWGVIAGTYSSVLLAVPVLLYTNLRAKKPAKDTVTQMP